MVPSLAPVWGPKSIGFSNYVDFKMTGLSIERILY